MSEATEQHSEYAPPATAPDIDLIVTRWEQEMLHNSAASRDTDGFNHLVTEAIPDLRRRLKGII